MPLKSGKKNIGNNIAEEKKAHPNMKQDQAVAIGINASKKKKDRK